MLLEVQRILVICGPTIKLIGEMPIITIKDQRYSLQMLDEHKKSRFPSEVIYISIIENVNKLIKD